MRAMRAVFFDGGRNGLITKGASECSVEVSFEKGILLRWTRNPKANPIERWQLIGPDGNSVSENGKVYDTGGKTVPEWVHKISGIGPIEGHDPQIVNQKTPVFLLDKPGSVRATVLSIGQETSHIQAMIKLQRERSSEDRKLIKEGEREMADVLDQLSRLQQVIELETQIDDAERFALEIENHAHGIRQAQEMVSQLAKRRQELVNLRRSQELLNTLPDTATWNEQLTTLRECAVRSEVVLRLHEKRKAFEEVAINLKRLQDLPEEFPQIASNHEIVDIIERLKMLRERQKRAPQPVSICRTYQKACQP